MEAAAVNGPAWDLTSEYESVDDAALAADLAALDAHFEQAATLNGQLTGDDAVAAAQALHRLSEAASTLLSNVSTFAHCLLSVDSQHEGAQQLNGRLQRYRKTFGDVFQPLSQWIDDASDDVVEAYLADADVAPSAFLVHHGRERRHENLTLAEESLVNGLSQDGIHAWGNLYDQLAGTLTCEVQVGNETRTMGLAEASGRLSSAHDHERQAAWQAINTAWEAHEESCAASINAIAGWRLELARQRSRTDNVHYLDAPVHMNRISRETLDTLLDAAARVRPLAQRAAQLQARAYGKEGFGPWDIRAPAPVVGGDAGSVIPFEEALEIIASAYSEADPSMGEFVHMMAERRWIEGTVGPRKSPGAYCTSFATSKPPRVYMPYPGGQSDVITLAHELGHALHSWVMRDLPESQLSYGMSLAETASTFGETLVRDALLARADSPQAQLDIVWEEMSAFTAFLLNIPARYSFERNFYDARAERPLRPQELKDLMSAAWTEWYGDALAEPDPMFWASKLHFYISGLSFYNFPYLFGYLFSLGVYARREQFGNDFYPRYVALLRDTGRMTAEELADKHLRARLQDGAFWQETLAALEPRVDTFERLLDDIESAT